MSDQEKSFIPKDKDIQTFEKEEDIPIDEDSMLFNPGHSEGMGKALNRIFDNEFTDIYKVGGDSGRLFVSIDMDGFSRSKYMTDPRMVEELLRVAYQQIRLKATMPQGYMQMAERSSQNAEKYAGVISSSLKLLNHDSRVLGKFVEEVEDRGLVIGQNKIFVENIKETIKLAETLSNSNGSK